MSFPNAQFYKMRAKILLFCSLRTIMQSLYNNQVLLSGGYVERLKSHLLFKEIVPEKKLALLFSSNCNIVSFYLAEFIDKRKN